MPEISFLFGFILAIVFGFIGWIVAINLSFIPQLIIFAILLWCFNSWKFRQLGLGIYPYVLILFGYVVGSLSGNVVYFLLYGFRENTILSSILALFLELITP